MPAKRCARTFSRVQPDMQTIQGTWPGRECGVRAPEPDETPLTAAEVQTGANFGLLRDPFDEVDQWPVTQLWRPVGSWEKRRAALLAKPTHWDGLAR